MTAQKFYFGPKFTQNERKKVQPKILNFVRIFSDKKNSRQFSDGHKVRVGNTAVAHCREVTVDPTQLVSQTDRHLVSSDTA